MSADPLVGRSSALAVLATAAAAARERGPGLVLVTGEPGIGKTALLSEAARRLSAEGAHVLWGQCWESEGTPAYWPWIQIVRSAVSQGAPDIAALGRLRDSPGASGALPAGPEARFELFDGVVRLLSALARDGPVVVVLDDLQWIDEASQALLEFAVRHLHQAGVLLLGAYRELEAPSGLGRVTALAETLPLTGLDVDGVAALVAQMADAGPTRRFATSLRGRTGGNPLFVRELTRLILARGGRLPEVSEGLPLVDSVRETLQQRLSRLSPACARMLEVAAVAGPEVRPDMLRRLLEDPDGLRDLLGEAVAAKVLIPSDPPGTYRFSHDLFRETIYASLPPGEADVWHIACGRLLEALAGTGVPVHAAEVAAHFLAASPGEASVARSAVSWSRRAAVEAVARLAADDARQHYQRALSMLDSLGHGGELERVGMLCGLADAHNRAGDATAARASYLQAAMLARNLGDADGLAQAALGIHELGAPSGLSHAEPIALLEEAAGQLDTSSPLRPLVLASLARDLYHSWEQDHVSRAGTLAGEAVLAAQRIGNPATLSRCLLARHDTQWVPGSARSRLAIADEIRRLAAAGDRDLFTLALLLRATAKLELGDPDGYRDLTGYCEEVSRYGHARGRWQSLSRRATAALVDGDLARAGALSAQAAQLGERIGEPDWSSVADGQLWEVLRFSGERHRYAEAGRSGHILAEWPPWRAIGLAEAGELAAAEHLLAGFDLDRSFRPGPRASPESWSMAIVAEAVAMAGTLAQRAEMYRRLTPLAGMHVITGGCASYSGAFDHYLGLLAAAMGRPGPAAVHFGNASTMHERLGSAAWLALSRRHRDQLDVFGDGGPAPGPVLRPEGGTWRISYAGRDMHLPDLKGLHDLATLVASPGRPVHVMQLLTGVPGARPAGSDPVLDEQAKIAYRNRILQLDAEIDEADTRHDLHRAERSKLERAALVDELAAAAGLGGRDRRLGDDIERARKTVTSRIRDAINRIRRQHPALAQHLDDSITTGTECCYAPPRTVTN